MAPPPTKEEQLKAERTERANLIKDIKDGVIRAAVVPCCYSLEEFFLGLCYFPEIRLKNLKLLEEEIGYGADKMKLFSRRIMGAYFTPNPQLFSSIFGFPLSELHPDGLVSVRPWHDETIAVMAPHKTSPVKLLVNAIMRETLAQEHKHKLTWQGNCLMFSLSLQSDIHRDLGGVTRYALMPALQDKLRARAAEEVTAKWRRAGVDLEAQFGWLAGIPKLPTSTPSASAPLHQQLEYMMLGWKMQRCLLPQRHLFEKCPGYHVVQYKPNSNTPIFDARRPPLKAGKLLYHAVHCKEGADSSSSHYLACAAGPGCDKSHSLVELFYNPEHFKRQGCEALRGGRCANSEAGLPMFTCAFCHSTAELEALTAVMKRIAPQLKPPASIPGLPTLTDSSGVTGNRISTPGSSTTAASATMEASSAAPAAHEGSGSRDVTPASRLTSYPGSGSVAQEDTDREEFPGLPAGPANKKTKKQAAAATGASSCSALTQQQQQQGGSQGTCAPVRGSVTGTQAVIPPRSTSPEAGQAAGVAVVAEPGDRRVAAAEPSPEGPDLSDAGATLPQTFAEVDADTLSFLFQGPSNTTAAQLQWYYIDPDGQVQGPFAPADLIDWCLSELLPIHLLVSPGQQDEPAPTTADMFWPLNELIYYAAQSRAKAATEPPPPTTAAEQAGHSAAAEGSEVAAPAMMPPTDTVGQLTAAATPAVTAPVVLAPGAEHPTQSTGDHDAAAAVFLAAGGAVRAAAASAPLQPAEAAAAAASVQPAAAAAAGPSATATLKKSVSANATPVEPSEYNLLTAPADTSAAVEQASSSRDSSSSHAKPIGGSYSPLRAVEAASAGAMNCDRTAGQAPELTAGAAAVTAADTSVHAAVSRRLQLNVNAAPFMPGPRASTSPATTPGTVTPVAAAEGPVTCLTAPAATDQDGGVSDTARASGSEMTTAAKASETSNAAGDAFTVTATAVTAALGLSDGAAMNPGPRASENTAAGPATAEPAVAETLTGALQASRAQVAPAAAGTGVFMPISLLSIEPQPAEVSTSTAAAAAGQPAGLESVAAVLPEQTPAKQSALMPEHEVDQVLTATSQQLQVSGPVEVTAAGPAAEAASSSSAQPATHLTIGPPVVPTTAAAACTASSSSNAVLVVSESSSHGVSIVDDDRWQTVKHKYPWQRWPLPGTAVGTLLTSRRAVTPAPEQHQDQPEPEASAESALVEMSPVTASAAAAAGVTVAAVKDAALLKNHFQLLSAVGGDVDESFDQLVPAEGHITVRKLSDAGAASATSKLQHPGQVSVKISLYNMHAAAALQEPVKSLQQLVSSTALTSALSDLVQYTAAAEGMQCALMLAVRHNSQWPHPQFLALQQQPQPQQQLSDVCCDGELELEAYCGSLPVSACELPVLYQYVLVGREFKDNLWQAVFTTTGAATATEREQQQQEMMQHLCKVFAAALSAGLLWRHDRHWAVFNSGLPRQQDPAQPQLIFIRRNAWAPAATGAAAKPWVATKKMVSLSEAATWLKGTNNIPPAPACQPWNALSAPSSRSSSSSSSVPPIPGQSPEVEWVSGCADREATCMSVKQLVADNRSSSPSSTEQTGNTAAVPEVTRETEAPAANRMPQNFMLEVQREQQQQQQQQHEVPAAVWLPATADLGHNIAVLSSAGAALTLGGCAGRYSIATPAAHAGTVDEHTRGGRDGSVITPPQVPGQSASAGMPLLTTPMLPAMSGAMAAAAVPETLQQPPPAAAAAASPVQQHEQFYRVLSGGYPGLQLVLDCSLRQQQHLHKQGRVTGGAAGGRGRRCQLLVSQSTPAEEVAAAVAQWLSAQVEEQPVPPLTNSGTSMAPAVLLAYHQVDRVSDVKSWRLLKCDQLLQCAEASQLQDSSRPWGCAITGGQVHPLGAQMIFSAVLSTLEVQVYPVNGSTDVSGLFAMCTGTAGSHLLSDVCKAAATEYWGSDLNILQHYLAENFLMAATQGRLYVKGAHNNSSSSIDSSPQRVLPGAVGLLAMRAVQQQQEQPWQERLMLFNTGLFTEAGQQLFVTFKEPNNSFTTRSAAFRYHRTVTSFQCSGLQPLPAPAIPPIAAFNPATPLHIDLDMLLCSAAAQQGLQQHLRCQGQPLPQAAWHSLVQGGLTTTLLQLQRTPGIALQLLAGERVLQVLPLFMLRTEPVQLVLLVEQLVADAAGDNRAFYGGGQLMPFADAYKHVRALGQVTWISWVQQAVDALLQCETASAADDGEILKLKLEVSDAGSVLTHLAVASS